MIDVSKLDYEKIVEGLRRKRQGEMVTSLDIKVALKDMHAIDSILHVSYTEIHAIFDMLIMLGVIDRENLLIIPT